MSGKLVGPIRRESAQLAFRLHTREVLVEKKYNPEDQLELLAKSVVPKKLETLAIQLQVKEASHDRIEKLLKRLSGEEKFSMRDLSEYLDIVMHHVGSFHDPVFVIEAVTFHSLRLRSDVKLALPFALDRFKDFTMTDGPEQETQICIELLGH